MLDVLFITKPKCKINLMIHSKYRNSQNKIIINIGADVYLEVEYKQALVIIERNLIILSKKQQLLNDQIIKNKAYYKLTLNLIEKLKNEKN
jgi:prefoldin subunit 5